ncbi:SLATT domain-containing protein [Streptomyces sp. OE57]|uniref:SLATT domain-containing protein n=1 Tax=Streptomyces lacaronensis TaxID=3379885 RepID=UPI0039B75F45
MGICACTGKELTWQSVTLTVISFAITVSTMFTGYYKFRERSHFLQQTADAIEEEANAVTLGVGPYREYGPGREQEALKVFTQRMEDHRNEQRRRQQQLRQPADQALPTAASPTP